MDHQNLSAPPCAQVSPARPVDPSDLAVAIEVGQRMLNVYGTVGNGDYAYAHGAVTEALRILVRAAEQAAARRSVDAQFPAVAAFLAAERGEGQ